MHTLPSGRRAAITTPRDYISRHRVLLASCPSAGAVVPSVSGVIRGELCSSCGAAARGCTNSEDLFTRRRRGRILAAMCDSLRARACAPRASPAAQPTRWKLAEDTLPPHLFHLFLVPARTHPRVTSCVEVCGRYGRTTLHFFCFWRDSYQRTHGVMGLAGRRRSWTRACVAG